MGEGALARLNKEHLTKTESSNIAAETSHGEDPGDISDAQIDDNNSKGVEEHLTKTESSNIAAETSHGEDPGDISLAEIDKRNATTKAERDPCDPETQVGFLNFYRDLSNKNPHEDHHERNFKETCQGYASTIKDQCKSMYKSEENAPSTEEQKNNKLICDMFKLCDW